MGVTLKWNDLWPILPKSTFLKTYPIPIGHDTKTVIYLNYIFRFGLGLRWVISFSVSCFSLFMICLSLDDRTPVRFFDFFERDQFIEKCEWKESCCRLTERQNDSPHLWLIQLNWISHFVFRAVGQIAVWARPKRTFGLNWWKPNPMIIRYF